MLKAAIELFNRTSTADVSVEDIAVAARMTPVELSAHFRDKPAIIRALFDQYISSLDGLWRPEKDPRKNVAKMTKNLVLLDKERWEYRFIHRELPLLVRADARFKAIYDALYSRRISEIRVFIQQLVLQDLMRVPRLPRTIEDLITTFWLVADGWHTFLEVTGDPYDPVQMARINDMLMVVIDPYLTDEGRELFEKLTQ
ncbi:TetR family transcriptional regulator [Kibdelosporangium philippinense]|uniref:TetR family transcriptional regulator n=1 Tax=Kibdelosporangium philippinense TaxID=211113 RepID=A0ABS8ZWP9_9PSEU|nr:TetR/AcrR family transcriptional regulator [Kibdelosporangium philippinense]MCE7012067.1 TetR family transcriptional regulator [Kibdelosporangium philippinense]